MNKFLKEIMEQPSVIEEALAFYTSEQGMELLEKSKTLISKNNIERIIFTGMGSSYFISYAASILFNGIHIPAFVVNASELLHYNSSLLKEGTLLVCLSQSGESFEIKEILKEMPQGVHCIGIVNEENSTLARNADVALLCKAGKEEMTSTKTFVLTMLVTYILAASLSKRWNETTIKNVKKLTNGFSDWLQDYDTLIDSAIDFLGDIQTLQIIARGPAFAAASQSALMFKEAVKIPATGILGGEFRHGPMEMVADGFKAILFAAKGKTLSQSIKMAEDIVAFGGKVLLITNDEIEIPHQNIMKIFVAEPDEYLFSIQSIVPVQLFIDAYAKAKGFEAGSFSRGAKVTVIE